MSLPGFTAEAAVYNTSPNYRMSGADVISSTEVIPQGCNWRKKIRCAGAVVACGASCASGVGTAACIACFAGVGASSCVDCLQSLISSSPEKGELEIQEIADIFQSKNAGIRIDLQLYGEDCL